MTRRDPVVLAWIGGIALAGLVYAVGPDQFMFRLQDTLHVLAWRISESLGQLSLATADLVRALAIGLYATFLVLALAVSRRGGRWKAALVLVSLLFLMLIDGGPGTHGLRWTAALIVSAAGAALMTGRLRESRLVVRS